MNIQGAISSILHEKWRKQHADNVYSSGGECDCCKAKIEQHLELQNRKILDLQSALCGVLCLDELEIGDKSLLPEEHPIAIGEKLI